MNVITYLFEKIASLMLSSQICLFQSPRIVCRRSFFLCFFSTLFFLSRARCVFYLVSGDVYYGCTISHHNFNGPFTIKSFYYRFNCVIWCAFLRSCCLLFLWIFSAVRFVSLSLILFVVYVLNNGNSYAFCLRIRGWKWIIFKLNHNKSSNNVLKSSK